MLRLVKIELDVFKIESKLFYAVKITQTNFSRKKILTEVEGIESCSLTKNSLDIQDDNRRISAEIGNRVLFDRCNFRKTVSFGINGAMSN